MRILYFLLVILFCSTSLHAEQLSILTELELIQEKIWYIQRDMGAQKNSLEELQKQQKLLASGLDKKQLVVNERLTALTQATNRQAEIEKQRESTLKKIGEALTILVNEAKQQKLVLQDQEGKISTLEGSLSTLRDGLLKQQTDAKQALTDLRTQLSEAQSQIVKAQGQIVEAKSQIVESRAQMVEALSQLESAEQEAGGQVEKISYWIGGAVLILAILLTIGLALRKNKTTSSRRPSDYQ